jgi:predicted ATPase/class 3 adenylate cyclase
MGCPWCRANNADVAGLYVEGGAALVLTCPQCGTELPPQANFCFRCGSPVTGPSAEAEQSTLGLLQRAVERLAPQGYAARLLATRGQVGRERRIVTILFCDVQGSTSLAESLDPEEVVEVMDGAFDVLIPPIYHYEGTVARLMGDAVLAFFGAPIAHEDDPERACLAALEIVDSAKGYAAKLEQDRGIGDFNVRVGIHTGLVVVGEVGSDLRAEYTAMGDAVNLAQRLQCAAEPGDVLISADMQRLIAPLFETEALGPMPLRGRAQPVAVYRVVAARPVQGKPRGIAGLDSPQVGRDAEMTALQAAIGRLRGGQGGIVTIVGEAGVGKSRLVAEAREGVMRQLQGCHPEGTEGSGSSREEKILRFAQNDSRWQAQGKLRFAQNDSRWQAQGRLRFGQSGKKIPFRVASSPLAANGGLAQGRLRFAQNDSRWQAQGKLRFAQNDRRWQAQGRLRFAQNDRRWQAQGKLRFAQNDRRWQAQGRLRFAQNEKILRFAQNDRCGGVQWVEGRCVSYGGGVAYQLWTDVLRHLMSVESDATPDRVRQALQGWVQALCPDGGAAMEAYLANMMALPLQEEEEALLAQRSSEQIQAATFDAMQMLIECTARRQPLVLVCEDIYWSDPTSMALLEQLLPLTEQLPLLLIAVLRPRKEHPSWRIRALAAQRYADRHTDLWLQRLSEGHSQQLLSNLLPMPAVAQIVHQRILEGAEGNPLYVEEITRALIVQGILAQDDSTGQSTLEGDVAEMAIPDTLNGVLTARIDQLPEAAKRVLQMAAVIGRLFSYPILAAIAGLDGPLEPQLMALQEAGLIRERAGRPEREYTFQNELIRQAAYNGLLKQERRVLHRQVAETLERLFPGRVGEPLGLLAHHWERAGEADKAAECRMRAGDRSRTALAKQEAGGRLQGAVPLAHEHDQERHAPQVRAKPGWAQKKPAFGFP